MCESTFDERANARDAHVRLAASPHPEVCLLLRADAEMRCLSREVLPSLRELERAGDSGVDAPGVASAYLEVLWIEAQERASATEAAFADAVGSADASAASPDDLLEEAERLHTAVSMLRKTVTRRIARVLGPAGSSSGAAGSSSTREPSVESLRVAG
jgi:hypothetical protein